MKELQDQINKILEEQKNKNNKITDSKEMEERKDPNIMDPTIQSIEEVTKLTEQAKAKDKATPLPADPNAPEKQKKIENYFKNKI